MMPFNKEQLENLMSGIKENIALSEMLLAKNSNIENADDIRSLIRQQQESLEYYMDNYANWKIIKLVGQQLA